MRIVAQDDPFLGKEGGLTLKGGVPEAQRLEDAGTSKFVLILQTTLSSFSHSWLFRVVSTVFFHLKRGPGYNRGN